MKQISFIVNVLIGFFLFWLEVAVVIHQWEMFPFRFIVNVINMLDFGIHEMGHMVFGLFGNDILGALGGSLFQWGAPLVMMSYAIYKKKISQTIILFFWFGISLTESAPYIMDARTQKLPMLSPFILSSGNIKHDWNFLLSQFHLLWADQFLGGLFMVSGCMVMLCSIILIIIPRGWILEWDGWAAVRYFFQKRNPD